MAVDANLGRSSGALDRNTACFGQAKVGQASDEWVDVYVDGPFAFVLKKYLTVYDATAGGVFGAIVFVDANDVSLSFYPFIEIDILMSSNQFCFIIKFALLYQFRFPIHLYRSFVTNPFFFHLTPAIVSQVKPCTSKPSPHSPNSKTMPPCLPMAFKAHNPSR